MTRPPRSEPPLDRAFDEARFGRTRTLDLRSSLPTAVEAVGRTETWLRERQAHGGGEVLIITGRGNQSADGVAVVRPAVAKRLALLQRQGVVANVQEHTAGSFVVTLAPLKALLAATRRRRGTPPPEPADPESLRGLPADIRSGLRDLAARALDDLRVPRTEAFVAGEMQRIFARLAAGLETTTGREERLRAAIRAALDEE